MWEEDYSYAIASALKFVAQALALDTKHIYPATARTWPKRECARPDVSGRVRFFGASMAEALSNEKAIGRNTQGGVMMKPRQPRPS